MSWPPTLADAPGLLRAMQAEPHMPVTPGLVTVVRAPCCGRRTAAHTVIDVRAVAGTVVRGGGVREPVDHDWLCDGCVHRLYADQTNPWTPSKLYSALGAPPDAVRFLRARELASEAATADHRAGRPHRPNEAHAAALASLPVGRDPHRVAV